MRILHVLATCDPVLGGGVAERTRHLSQALVNLGATCTILTSDVGLDARRRAALSHVDLQVLPCLSKRFFLPAAWPGTIRAAVAAADVVELTSHWTVLNAMAYRAARTLGVPYLVHPAGALSIFGRSKNIKKLFNKLVGHNMVRNANGHIAVTSGEAPEYEGYGVSADRLTLIPNGVDLPSRGANPARFRDRLGLDADTRIILFVGRLSSIKGPDLLLEAFSQVADVHPNHVLVFVGPDNGMLSSLQETAASRGIAARVRFPGFLEGLEKDEAYQACDFLALPSRREAMSIVALEAGVRGKPVLLTDQCGFDEVETCGGGHIVRPTEAGLQAGLEWMIQHQESLPAMGAALERHVRTCFTWPVAANKYLELCETVQRTMPGGSVRSAAAGFGKRVAQP
jgi:glycosyltransferase involved in cell wall biosynthesis